MMRSIKQTQQQLWIDRIGQKMAHIGDAHKSRDRRRRIPHQSNGFESWH